MAKNNAGDVLTGDWNPIVGCVRYSAGCKNCWFLDGIFPWQQRLGNIPPEIKADEPYYPEKRWHTDSLKTKNGIIGICQHGDLFWDKVSDERVHGVLDIIDEVAPKKIRTRRKAGRTPPKYLLWTKRAQRANEMLTSRYHLDQPGSRVPDWYGIGVSMEDQAITDERMPYLTSLSGFRVAVFEPIIGPVDIRPYIDEIDWVIVGSETSDGARVADKDWFRRLRDVTKEAGKPFFLKQLGSSHKSPERELDGRTWEEFPRGWVKA